MSEQGLVLVAETSSRGHSWNMIRIRKLLARRMYNWIVPALVVIACQAACSFGLAPANLLPSPASVVSAAWRLTLSGELPQNVGVSFLRAIGGLAIGGSIGFFLGLANGLSKISFVLTDSTLQMVRNIPHLAMIPLVILWFGIDEEAKLFLVSIGVFFPIYINTLHGVRSVDPHLVEMARSYGMENRTSKTRSPDQTTQSHVAC